jgi:uncharacterized protein YpiB (UPF0302 family)
MDRSNLDFLPVNCDHGHKYMLLRDIDEAMDEDDQLDMQSDHVQQLNILENDH